MLTVSLRIKFRVLGVTFGTYATDFHIPIPPEAAVFAALIPVHVAYNDHGVTLTASVA